MKKYHLLLCLINLAFLFNSCQKELVDEFANIPAKGNLPITATGECLPQTVQGIYEVSKSLVPDSNKIIVTVNATTAGNYNISTDTLNGFFFRGKGVFPAPGLNNITLSGSGKPLASGVNNFRVLFDSSSCTVAVAVSTAGSSGLAIFSLVSGGTPANCANAIVNGSYFLNAPVTSSNTVTVSLNVTKVGTYSIRASGTGLTFSKSGSFTATGNQTVTLTASGTATTEGANTITFNQPAGGCTFTVNVIGASTYSYTCAGTIVNGTYAKGTALSAANTVSIQVNVSAIGSYNITTSSGGMTFAKAGGFTSTGLQTVTLNGTGTPATAGNTPFTLNPGACNFTVSVVGPGTYTFGGAPGACTTANVGGTYTTGVPLGASNTLTVQVTVSTPGSYNISTVGGGMTFSKSGIFTATGVQSVLLAGSGTPNSSGNITFTVGNNGCSFSITVIQPTGNYQCKIDGVLTVFGDRAQATILDDFYSPPRPYLYLNGYTGAPNGGFVPQLQIFIERNNMQAVGTGTYNVDGLTITNGYRIEIDLHLEEPDGTVIIWNTSSTLFTANPPFTIIITSVTSGRIRGTFSGTVKNTLQGGALKKVVTEGVFDLPIL